MSVFGHFADEFAKIAFSVKVPPVTTSMFGKTTQGAVAKPLTKTNFTAVKTPLTQSSSTVPSSVGKIKGIKVDSARRNSPPPPIRGGSNVR